MRIGECNFVSSPPIDATTHRKYLVEILRGDTLCTSREVDKVAGDVEE